MQNSNIFIKNVTRKTLLNGLLFLVFLSVVGCSGSEKECKEVAEMKDFKTIAFEKYGSDVRILPNFNESYMLCVSQEKKSAQVPFPPLKYFIFDTKNSEIVFEESLPNGSVSWDGEYTIEIKIIPGQMKGFGENNTVYFYDVQKREKYNKP